MSLLLGKNIVVKTVNGETYEGVLRELDKGLVCIEEKQGMITCISLSSIKTIHLRMKYVPPAPR